MNVEQWCVIYNMGKFDLSCFESRYKPICDAFAQLNAKFYDKELNVVPVSSMRQIEEETVEIYVGKMVLVSQIE